MDKGKIDFIVCEAGGAWYIESLQVPQEIAVLPDADLVEFARSGRFQDEHDVIFIGVYWRDEHLDLAGLTTSAAVTSAYKKLHGNTYGIKN